MQPKILYSSMHGEHNGYIRYTTLLKSMHFTSEYLVYTEHYMEVY